MQYPPLISHNHPCKTGKLNKQDYLDSIPRASAMAYLDHISHHCPILQPKRFQSLILEISIIILFMVLPRHTTDGLSFNLSSIDENDLKLKLDATVSGEVLDLTNNKRDETLTRSAGRALYSESMQLWRVNGTGKIMADFNTCFSFNITSFNTSRDGHGLTFLLAPENEYWNPNRSLPHLFGLFESNESARNSTGGNQVVAVEFDTYPNGWDPLEDHMGIDVNSIVSKSYVTVTGGLVNRGTANACVTYSSEAKILSASLIFHGSPDSHVVSHEVDLSAVLPERVQVGFTATTGKHSEIHEVYSWSFSSNLEDTPDHEPVPPSTSWKKVGLAVAIPVGLFVIIISGATLLWFRSRRKASAEKQPEFDADLGPKRFSYSELSQATNSFAEELKLGKGGFGDVYEGALASSNAKVAVKKFRRGSVQGVKEYISEVKIISKLSHKNLVKLMGWCHEKGELLLVYEYMPNRSLDFHLFGNRSPKILPWPTRYTIALGLASGLEYLQYACDQCVVHRDIKSSNVMLDSNFITKLGDFGLARITDHDRSLNATTAAGTMGYLAPEIILEAGNPSKHSDTYSFGVVALEIGCGRRAVHPGKRALVEWVWGLYGKGKVLEAIDGKLNGVFDEKQARSLMVVGLWCCHPDPGHRPSMKQVIAVLNFEAPEPALPLSIPRAIYYPAMYMSVSPSSSSTYEDTSSSS